MKKVKLIDVCDVQYGYAFESSLFNEDKFGRQLIRIRDVLRGYSETYTNEKCSEEYVVNKGDLLVGMDGEFNIAQWKIDGAVLNQRVCKLTPHKGLHKRYLYYALIDILKKIEERTSFVTVKHLSAKEIKKIEFRLPSIEEQKEIADRLDKVVGLIEKRKEQLAKLDQLVKSRFIEMFANKDFPKTALIDLIVEGAGLSYGIVQPGDDGTGEMGVLRPVDIVECNISIAGIKYIDRSIGDGYKKTELTGDELLITVRGTTGITALTDARFVGMNVTRGIAVIRYDRRKINPIYLNAYLKTEDSQRYIQEHTRGATLQQINLSDLRMQDIVVPPMELQNEFATFVEQVDKSKFEIQQSIDKLETLKKSLMQQYFG